MAKKTAKKKTAKRSAPKPKSAKKKTAKNPRAKIAAPGRKRPSAKARAVRTVKRRSDVLFKGSRGNSKPAIEEQKPQEVPPFEEPAAASNPVGSLEDDLAREVSNLPAGEGEGKCFNCGKPTGKEGFCFGCKSYVCEECDKAAKDGGLFGAHQAADHLVDPDLLEEQESEAN